MPSEIYQQFLNSMIMDYDKWHDGTGYDLEALGQLGPVVLIRLTADLNVSNIYLK